MKITLLILTLLCSFQGFGQFFIPENKSDTIPVLILYCDTTSKSITVNVSIQPELQENNQFLLLPTTPVYEVQKVTDNDVYWMEGYLVEFYFGDPFEFLDKNKKRIPKNIIIWDWRNI